jgi:diacylglycerol kinase (ATP)
MERIGFILHGKIRGKRNVKRALGEKFSGEYEVAFYETLHPRHAEDLTRHALSDGCDFLIAVGGDGTLNEMVNGYLRSGGSGASQARLGVLPYGTGNDFARNNGIGRDINRLAGLIKGNRPVMLDAGRMELHRQDGSPMERYFDNIADIGIGADVVVHVNGVHLRKKILGGTLTFFLSALFTFLTYKHKPVRLSWPGFEWEGSVLSVVVANGRYFGSGLGIAPEAKMDDGLFEVVVMGKVSVIDYLRNFARLRRAEKINHPEVSYYRTARLSILTDEQSLTIVEADGEVEGRAPIVYTCLPGVLPFLVPGGDRD